MQIHCLYEIRKYKTRVKSELRKQQYTVTLFDRNHLAHLIVLQLYEKCNYYCVNVQFLLSCIFCISRYEPLGACIWRGDLKEGFLRLQVWGGGGGPYAWRGLFYGILRYYCID